MTFDLLIMCLMLPSTIFGVDSCIRYQYSGNTLCCLVMMMVEFVHIAFVASTACARYQFCAMN